MTDISQVAGIEAARETVRRADRDHLFGPAIDFFCLGGGSFIILGLICWLLPKGLPKPETLGLVFVLVTLINNPHFANSYQIFYRNYREKAFGSYPQSLRWRYVFAGIVVPVALVISLAVATIMGVQQHTGRYLGWLIAPMYFLTGWHYVKQGYGILMVDSTQAKIRFSDRAKLIFRINAYACWALAWLDMNHSISRLGHYNGVARYNFALPFPFYIAALVVCEITSIAVLGILFRRWRETRELPWNGVLAYAASLYPWLVFGGINPLMFVVVPTFHSLQYIVVVWRYRLNAESEAPKQNKLPLLDRFWPDGAKRRLALFVAVGIFLGYLGFALLPHTFDRLIPYDKQIFGPVLFVFMFSLFINIHHYFMDNVIWRRGNPDVLKYVFMQRQ